MRIPWKKIGKTSARVVASKVGLDIFSGKVKFKNKKDLADFISFTVEHGVYNAFRRIEKEDKR